MTRLWPLYAAVGLATVSAIALLLIETDRCPEGETGVHEYIPLSEDTALGRRWRMRCLHCWKPTPGFVIPWLRKYTRVL